MSTDEDHVASEQHGHICDIFQFKDDVARLRRDAMEFTRRLEDLTGKAEQSVRNNVLLKSYDPPSLVKRPRKQGEGLPVKEYAMQNSVLTDLFESKHMQVTQNIIVAVIVWWLGAMAVADFYEHRNIMDALPSIGLIRRSCANGRYAVVEWLKLLAMTLAIYPLTRFWANHRPNKPHVTCFDRFFLLGYVVYQAFYLSVPFRILFVEPIFGTAAATAVTMEQVRFMMKMHSFVREIGKQCLQASDAKKVDEAPEPWKFPIFNKYLYFLFAPTLIYRDEYPRTANIRWGFVVSNFCQFMACSLFMYYIIDRYLLPELVAYRPETVSFEVFLKCWIRCAIPGMAAQLMGFFGFFHSWLNAWAEMLRFGDRVFYRDWWTCTDYGSYWRQWNLVVHDWLHAYIYKDFFDKIGKFKTMAAFLVFFVSSVFHEYILTAMLGFFYPLMFLYLGGIGFFLTTLNMKNAGRFSNVFMWWGTIMFMGLMFSLYAFEVSARNLCPPVYDNWFLDGVAFRFVRCWGRKLSYY